MEGQKSARDVNKENTDKLWEVLWAFRERPLSKKDLIELADFNHAQGRTNEQIFGMAIKKCRIRAKDKGLLIPMSVAANKHRYVLTADPNKAVDSSLMCIRQTRGVERNRDDHLNFIDRSVESLPPTQRILMKRVLSLNEEIVRVKEEQNEDCINLLSDLRKAEREASKDLAASE